MHRAAHGQRHVGSGMQDTQTAVPPLRSLLPCLKSAITILCDDDDFLPWLLAYLFASRFARST